MPSKAEEKPAKGEKKVKSAKEDGEKKKVKKDPKDKKDSTEKKVMKELKKEKDPEKEKKKNSKKDKETATQPARPPPRQPLKAPPESRKVADDYLGDMDLPSSESESDEEMPVTRTDDKKDQIRMTQASVRDTKKLAEKERKLLEKSVREKELALRDDDNVFDVSYENQGDNTADVVSATDIKVHNMTIRAKGKILLENAHLSITAGRRYGLVGPNGKGKSTLLRMIARRQIPVPQNLDVLLVEQEVAGSDDSALRAVVAADVELMQLREEEAEITARQESSEHTEANGNGRQANGDASTSGADQDEADATRLNEIYERMQEIGSASAEARASKILHGLGFTEVMQKRRTQDFSGGWRMRISLARALYIQPTVLLLDEPTNHLDLRAVLWLEEYLQRWKKTLVVVSHDRDFLNMVTTDIIHLHDERLHAYRGNFAQFEEMYEQRRREVNKDAEKFEKRLKLAKKSGSKANQDKVNKSAKDAQKRKAKGAGNAEDTPAADVPRKWNDYTVHFEFPPPTELSTHSLMQLNDVSFQYPGREDFGLKDLNIGIDMGSRVAIVGPNGAGKTTLMNLLAGDLQPTHGDSRKSHTLRVGRYAQHFVDALQMDENPVEYLLRKYPQLGLKGEQMRAYLGRFGLSGHHHLQPICKLSGGQKARVVFTSICLANPHILLLDEPTNHLDMQSIDALSDALEQFEGGVVVISHDSQMLSVVCDDAERSEVWLVEDGKVEKYDGYFQDYKDELMKEISDEMDEEEVYQRPDAKPAT